MFQGSLPMIMAAQSPMGAHFVPSSQQTPSAPLPGQKIPMALSAQGAIEYEIDTFSQNENDDQAYLEKIQQLIKYLKS